MHAKYDQMFPIGFSDAWHVRSKDLGSVLVLGALVPRKNNLQCYFACSQAVQEICSGITALDLIVSLQINAPPTCCRRRPVSMGGGSGGGGGGGGGGEDGE
jgi:hypothetical protein